MATSPRRCFGIDSFRDEVYFTLFAPLALVLLILLASLSRQVACCVRRYSLRRISRDKSLEGRTAHHPLREAFYEALPYMLMLLYSALSTPHKAALFVAAPAPPVYFGGATAGMPETLWAGCPSADVDWR